MKMLASLKNLLPVFSQNSAPVLAENPKAPVLPPKDLVPNTWEDDRELRALAEAYKADISKWVIASDLNEFYTKLDAFNATQPEARQIRVEVLKNMNDRFVESREKGGHIAANFMGDDQVVQYIGPHYIPDLRLRRGTEIVKAEYNANTFQTSLTIYLPSGEKKSVYFGMESADEVFGQPGALIGNSKPQELIP